MRFNFQIFVFQAPTQSLTHIDGTLVLLSSTRTRNNSHAVLVVERKPPDGPVATDAQSVPVRRWKQDKHLRRDDSKARDWFRHGRASERKSCANYLLHFTFCFFAAERRCVRTWTKNQKILSH